MNVYKVKIGSSTTIHITATDMNDLIARCSAHILSKNIGFNMMNEETGKKEFVYCEIKSIETIAKLTDVK